MKPGAASSKNPSVSAVPPGPVTRRFALPPLLPVILPILLAAVLLGVGFARFFPATGPARAVPVARFTDITGEAGLRFVHRGGGPDTPTTLGGGVAVLDFDGDGHPDLFFVNGAPWPWEEVDAMASPCALFRNEGTGHFTDVTRAAGLAVTLQGMAAAVGDYDNDGRPDIFVTCVGANHLFHNLGEGRFEDVSAAAGVAGDETTWSIGAAWIDVDGDGALDLVVSHYARWPGNVGLGLAFSIADVGHSYGAPAGFFSAFPSVYRNLGHGRFARLADAAGLRDVDRQTGLPVAKPLAVVPVDANADGRLDLLFSYQRNPNALFLNQGDGSFRKWDFARDERREGASAGLVSASGPAFLREAGADERLNALLSAGGPEARVADETRLRLPAKFAVATLDYDLDGQLEIFSGQGRAEPDTNKFESGRAFQSVPQLLVNDGSGWNVAAPVATEGGSWARPVVSRGIAVADFDGDGDADIVLAQNHASPVLLRNDQRRAAPWLRIQLVATRSQRDADGATVEVHTPGRIAVQRAAPVMGFAAQSEPVLTFGLGEDARVRRIVVRWPSGQRQEFPAGELNRTLVLRER